MRANLFAAFPGIIALHGCRGRWGKAGLGRKDGSLPRGDGEKQALRVQKSTASVSHDHVNHSLVCMLLFVRRGERKELPYSGVFSRVFCGGF